MRCSRIILFNDLVTTHSCRRTSGEDWRAKFDNESAHTIELECPTSVAENPSLALRLEVLRVFSGGWVPADAQTIERKAWWHGQ